MRQVRPEGSAQVIYSHFGDLGDTIYALPTIASLGPGELVLYPGPGRVREPYTPEKVERCRSFFEAQEYVAGVRFAEAPEGTVLDKWREKYNRKLNLADMVADAFGVPHWPREKPWLRVDRPNRVAAVIFHRSPRYHGRNFPWRIALRLKDAAFVGSKAEHEAFVSEFGPVPYYPTPTLADLASVIAGCELFVGNQSAPRAIAEGLKKPIWVEQCRKVSQRNTHWERPETRYD